ncbi:HpcH/HpaI aldolase/citrate lyase family protein [Aromatoleum petrolei]|uniref:CoA ester lyase n=1 Tax=Aromatoleum petrolei TaxID=76116 RepID=A0ABX1MMY7_9RHOO|nr:CoA ester lyase [Aromatoleum petrolei]NMF88566.1 CoA ester lyase [Aromatoleum petrolei]QTQ34726.1 HpcH/HpaI aldolase family protein [Aromatoleum petrolei]
MRSDKLPERSYLFVPANRPERIGKAFAAGADAVIADLEDAVAPDLKAAARDALANALSAPAPVLVRVNGADTPWFEDDLAACAAPGVAGIVLPKAERTQDVDCITERLGADMPVLALIETARGMADAEAIAACPAVRRLLFGSIDFQVDLGIEGGGTELLFFRSRLVLVSRLAGLDGPVDGVTVGFDDPATTRADAQRARREGFAGKLCVHPKQIAAVNAAFSPGAEEIAWAERVVAAAAAAGGDAVALDGKMIDKPVLAKAERILRVGGRFGQPAARVS